MAIFDPIFATKEKDEGGSSFFGAERTKNPPSSKKTPPSSKKTPPFSKKTIFDLHPPRWKNPPSSTFGSEE